MLFYTIYKRQHGLKTYIKPQNFKILVENIGKILLDTGLGNGFFGCDTKSISDKS